MKPQPESPEIHEARAGAGLHFELPFRPPYDWPWVLAFLNRRLIAGVEAIQGDAYWRAVRLPDGDGWASGRIRVRALAGRACLELRVAPGLAPVVDEVLARVHRLFDLDGRPDEFNAVLGELAHAAPGVRVPGAFDGFELAARAILGQQVTVKAAHTLAGRLAARFGATLEPPEPDDEVGSDEVMRVFPTPERIAELAIDDLAGCGLIRARAGAILAVARAIRDDGLQLVPHAGVEPTLTSLLALPGIGDWTAQYIAMRALGWRDAFPASDLILMRALGVSTPLRATRAAQLWRPWRAYAVMHLWRIAANPTVTGR